METEPAKISPELLEQLIAREFHEHLNEVTEKLKLINSDSETGRKRISAAVLKLAKKDISQLNQLIDRSNADFRDVVAEAEYPRAFKAGFDHLTDEEERKMDEEDWNEYQNWLNGK